MDLTPSHSHAVILSGSDMGLLRDEARRLTASLSCTSLDMTKRPCRLCAQCRRIYDDVYPYWFSVTPTGKAGLITVGQIEDLQSSLMTKPEVGLYKVAILEDAHRMRPEAANKLLKTLEEPPDSTMLLLLTNKPHDLLPTIRSRCRLLSLTEQTLTPDQVDLELAADTLQSLTREGYRAVFIKAKSVTESRRERLQGFMDALEYIVREAMLSALRTNSDYTHIEAFIDGLNLVWQAEYLIERNVNPLLVMENLFLKLMWLPAISIDKNEA